MLAIRNTVRQLFAMTTLLTIKAALLRTCGKQPPQPIQRPELAADTASMDALYVDESDSEETFAEWEADRNEKLHQVQDYEQRGLDLLAKAALLRAALRCDDRGETFIAEEIREQAEAIGGTSITEVPSDNWDGPIRDAVAAQDVPAQVGA